MSCCTFVIINKGEAKYVVAHYSWIKSLLKGVSKPEDFNPMGLYVDENGCLGEYTDTGFNPAVIINLDNKTLTNTPFNWFIDLKDDLPKDWKYQEIKPY